MTSETKCNFKQSRNWCATDFDMLDIKSKYNEYKDIVRYVCWGKEICPKTGRDHYQVWIQFKQKKRLRGCQAFFGTRLHVEPCRGSEYDNEKYCQKDGKYQSCGKFILQGARTALESIQNKLNKGKAPIDIAEDEFGLWCCYGKRWEEYQLQRAARRAKEKIDNKVVIVISGEGRTGKTTAAREWAGRNRLLIPPSRKMWMPRSWRGEKTVIIEELGAEDDFTFMNMITDKWKYNYQYKGGHVEANFPNVVITTNLKQNDLFPNVRPAQRAAFLARVIWIDWEIDMDILDIQGVPNTPLR